MAARRHPRHDPGADDLDLAATMPPKALRRVVRQAQAERIVNVRQIVEVLGRHRGHRGAAKLRAVVADGPTPTRSELEDLVLELIVGAGIERPEINPKLRIDARDVEPDLLWRGQRLIVECDGWRWHGNALTQRADADRQARLEAAGYHVLRITWQQAVVHPHQTVTRLMTMLTRAVTEEVVAERRAGRGRPRCASSGTILI